jgi:hypothetical protein
MTLEQLGGSGGFTYTQSSTPSNPSIGETWFDTSTDGGTGKIYADLGGGAQWHVLPVQDEIQSGRTRELLLLLQDQPVPEVVDPLNLQSGLSSDSAKYVVNNSDYELDPNQRELIADFEDGDSSPVHSNWSNWVGDTGNISAQTGTVISGTYSLKVSSFDEDVSVATDRDSLTKFFEIEISIQMSRDTGNGGDYVELILQGEFSSPWGGLVFNDNDGAITNPYNGNEIAPSWSAGTAYDIKFDLDWSAQQADVTINGTTYTIELGGSKGLNAIELVNRTADGGGGRIIYVDELYHKLAGSTSAYLTDRFEAPTTAPADFKAWNAIRAEDVTTGGSTSANPVEFEILDSSDTVLSSARIPKSELGDEPFKLHDREYSEDAGSNGQSDYTIPQTGAGGHYGLPILSVVTVEQNGSVLDPSNWEFDGTDTVTIDTSNVSIASGDTIAIKYDFDVFDSTLQPRAYLNRESTSETSPSISHFRYEYIV